MGRPGPRRNARGLASLVAPLALVVALLVARQAPDAGANAPTQHPRRGVLALTVSGLPSSTPARVAVSRRDQRRGTRILLASRSLSLPPGLYAVSAAAVGTPQGSYRPVIARQTIRVLPGRKRRLLVTYTPAPIARTESSPAPSVPTAPVPEPDPVVSITFDDGLRSQYANAVPVLDRYGFNATFYIHTAGLGDAGRLTPDMIRSMYVSGHQIAAHTVTHPHLTALSPAALQSELTESRQTLEGIIGTPIVDFASPYGDYNADVLSAIGAVFRTHRTASSGYNTMIPFNRNYIRTQTILQTTTAADVKQWIETAHDQIVRGFKDLTTSQMHAHWGLIPEEGQE